MPPCLRAVRACVRAMRGLLGGAVVIVMMVEVYSLSCQGGRWTDCGADRCPDGFFATGEKCHFGVSHCVVSLTSDHASRRLPSHSRSVPIHLLFNYLAGPLAFPDR